MADAFSPLKNRLGSEKRSTLRILTIAPLPFYGGDQETFLSGGSVFFAELLPRLAQLGHSIRVIAEAPRAPDGQRRTGLQWEFPRLGVEWFALEYHRGAIPLSPSSLENERERVRCVFDRVVDEQKPDIVLVGREILALFVAELCREHHLPSLLIVHGSPTATLLQGVYPKAARRRLVEGLRRIDGIITVAEHLGEVLKHFGIIPLCTIPNIADPVQFRPEPKDQQLLQDLHVAPDQIVISHLSTLKPGKRLLDVVCSAEIVLRANPRIVYLIVGDGPDRKEMEELGLRKGIAENFRYVGEIAHRTVPQYLNLSDIVVLPSTSEGCSLVYRETQACGKVLLVSDIPAAREAIIDGETGVLFRLKDVDDLATKTLALVQDPLRRQTIGHKARAIATMRTPEQWVREYEEVLCQVSARYTGFSQEKD